MSILGNFRVATDFIFIFARIAHVGTLHYRNMLLFATSIIEDGTTMDKVSVQSLFAVCTTLTQNIGNFT